MYISDRSIVSASYVQNISQYKPLESEDSLGAAKTNKPTNLSFHKETLDNYDMSNISPQEIDNLVKELTEAGYPFSEEMMMLSTRGASWRQHLAEIGAAQTQTEVTFDPNEKIDLYAEIKGNIEFNKQHGFDSSHFEKLLRFVSKLDGTAIRLEA